MSIEITTLQQVDLRLREVSEELKSLGDAPPAARADSDVDTLIRARATHEITRAKLLAEQEVLTARRVQLDRTDKSARLAQLKKDHDKVRGDFVRAGKRVMALIGELEFALGEVRLARSDSGNIGGRAMKLPGGGEFGLLHIADGMERVQERLTQARRSIVELTTSGTSSALHGNTAVRPHELEADAG